MAGNDVETERMPSVGTVALALPVGPVLRLKRFPENQNSVIWGIGGGGAESTFRLFRESGVSPQSMLMRWEEDSGMELS